jgi:hypothetical protein
MAQRDNPSKGGKPDKLIRDALMVAVNRVQEGDPLGRRKLAIAAAAVVEKAVEGDLAAFKEIADRIDGKAPQSLDVTTTYERPIEELSDVELAAFIARRSQGSIGTATEKGSKAKPDPVH